MSRMDPITTQSPKVVGAAETSGLGDRIVCTPGTCGGTPRIAGHRITVKHVVIDHQRGEMSPDEIASAYPSITLADVDAALAYYHDHRDEIDADIKADDEHWAEIERQNPGRLIDRLEARKADAADDSVPSR
jgi:uncharacterized protein (DUF433 family)